MKAEVEFTAEMARTMTIEEVRAFWRDRQCARRENGEAHYTKLVNAVTGEVVCSV